MRLPGHDHITAHSRRHTAKKDQSNQQSRIHKVLIRSRSRHDPKSNRARHEEALPLDEEVHFPARVILNQHAGVERAAGDEEDDRDAEVGCQGLFELLVFAWDLDLGGDCYDNADSDEEPLVLQGREDDVEPIRALAWVGGSCGGGVGVLCLWILLRRRWNMLGC